MPVCSHELSLLCAKELGHPFTGCLENSWVLPPFCTALETSISYSLCPWSSAAATNKMHKIPSSRSNRLYHPSQIWFHGVCMLNRLKKNLILFMLFDSILLPGSASAEEPAHMPFCPDELLLSCMDKNIPLSIPKFCKTFSNSSRFAVCSHSLITPVLPGTVRGCRAPAASFCLLACQGEEETCLGSSGVDSTFITFCWKMLNGKTPGRELLAK